MCECDGLCVQSQITVASDKSRGILGKAQLDLAQFQYDDFKRQRLMLTDCQFEDAWVEVSLKASVSSRNSTRNLDTSTANDSVLNESAVDTSI